MGHCSHHYQMNDNRLVRAHKIHLIQRNRDAWLECDIHTTVGGRLIEKHDFSDLVIAVIIINGMRMG